MDAATVIVPLDASREQALACLEGIAAQPPQPAFEVVVVAHGAPWLEPLLGQLDGDVTIVRCDRPLSLAEALRRGAERTGGEHLVLLTEAAVPQPGWLGGLLAELEDPDVAVATSTRAQRPAAPPSTARAAAWRRSQTPDLDAELPDGLVIATVALALASRGGRVVASPASVTRDAASPLTRGGLSPGTPAELTVVIPTLDAGAERVRRCLRVLAHTTEVAHQVLLVDNGAPAQGFSAPVNAGVRGAGTPYVVVMNDDVEVLPGWWPPLRAALDAGTEVAFPLTVHGGMREDFPAWCFALRRDDLDLIGHAPGELFDPRLVIWFQDTDLLGRLRARGCPPRLVADSHIRHGLSRTLGDPDPALADWVAAQTEIDRRRFEATHPDAVLVALTVSG